MVTTTSKIDWQLQPCRSQSYVNGMSDAFYDENKREGLGLGAIQNEMGKRQSAHRHIEKNGCRHAISNKLNDGLPVAVKT